MVVRIFNERQATLNPIPHRLHPLPRRLPIDEDKQKCPKNREQDILVTEHVYKLPFPYDKDRLVVNPEP